MPTLRSRGPLLHCLPGARNSHRELRACGISQPFAPTLPKVQTARPPRAVEFRAAAVEIFELVAGAEFLAAASRIHRPDSGPKNPGSFNKRSIRGSGRGEASRAAKKAFHLAGLRTK